MRVISIIIFLVSLSKLSSGQETLRLIDVSQRQIRLLESVKNLDSLQRNRIFLDSIYIPYKNFWNGYIGEGEVLVEIMNKLLAVYPKLLAKNKKIDGQKLVSKFREVEKRMTLLTGYKPKGNWYIVYGPAYTDLGGLGDFAMLIDLTHQNNNSIENIMKMFPHEITHQIMTNVNKHQDSSSISTIIGEGLAVWMNQKFWGSKYSIAENLGYDDSAFLYCENNLYKIKEYFKDHKFSIEKTVIDTFRNRSIKIHEKLPGAIGYYIGYKIIESYVKKHGEKSWKDVFIKSPRYIYLQSGF